MEDGNLLGINQPRHLDERDAWTTVASTLSHLKLTPFEAKALYVFALIRQLAQGSMILFEGSLHLPAFVVLADAVEALGRCRTGCQREDDGSGPRLDAGLLQLECRDDKEFRTMSGLYAVPEIRAMRNFTTHGGTTPKRNGLLDGHLSALLLNRLGDELTDYWVRLGQDGNPERITFAAARIRPLFTGGKPVFVEDMFNMMTKTGARAGQDIQVQLR